MTEQEIIEALGITEADQATKDSLLQNIYVVVELRVMSVLGEIITDEQMDHLEQMEKDGATKNDMLWWLGENVASAHEAIEAMTRDYVEEMKQKMASIQNSLELS